MSATTPKDALQKARTDAQALYKKLVSSAAKNQAQVRETLLGAADDAKRLGDSLKTLATQQRADTKENLTNAAARFDEAVADAKAAATASQEQIRAKNQAVIEQTRQALLNLSYAIASARSAVSKN
jgi:hypothetical protein